MTLFQLLLSAALGATLAFTQTSAAPAEEDEQPRLEINRLELLDGPDGYPVPRPDAGAAARRLTVSALADRRRVSP